MLTKILQRFFAYRTIHSRKCRYQNVDCGNVLPGLIDVLWERHWFRNHRGWTPTYIRFKG